MLPSAGQGAVSAIQDAIVLVNCIYDIEENTPQAIDAAFQEYQSLRYLRAKHQFDMSKMMGKLLIGQVSGIFILCQRVSYFRSTDHPSHSHSSPSWSGSLATSLQTTSQGPCYFEALRNPSLTDPWLHFCLRSKIEARPLWSHSDLRSAT